MQRRHVVPPEGRECRTRAGRSGRGRGSATPCGLRSQRPADDDGAEDRDQRAGDLRRMTRRPHDDDARHADATPRPWQAGFGGISPASRGTSRPSPRRLRRDAEHAGDLAHGHLDAHAGEEADEHAPRQEVGEEAEAHEARHEQEGAGHDGQHAGERDVAAARRSAASPARPAAMIAAVAESAPTTRCRDEPSTAKTAIGMRIVYRPVTPACPRSSCSPSPRGCRARRA